LYYKIKLTDKAKRDLRRINNYLEEYKLEKIYKKIKKDIYNLKFMPRIHKTVIPSKDKKGEYRRIVSGNYIIIYQIIEQEINI